MDGGFSIDVDQLAESVTLAYIILLVGLLVLPVLFGAVTVWLLGILDHMLNDRPRRRATPESDFADELEQ